MPAPRFAFALAGVLVALTVLSIAAPAQSPPPWQGPPPPRDDAYRPPRDDAYRSPPPQPPPDPYPPSRSQAGEPYYPPGAEPRQQPGEPYPGPYAAPGPYGYDGPSRTYSSYEIVDAGHRFFGSITKGLAGVVEYAFQQQGRPNGYILGQDAGGALIAGLRYGEGVLYT
ncbi:MAG TPA: EipA family protein, partial [Hyphomicrobiaceae bacterium]|nr:EipA family protein [Hyphomicrobiaceae bacterium]